MSRSLLLLWCAVCVLPSIEASWTEIDGKALSCTADEYQGTLGTMDKGEDCLHGAQGQGSRVNYALWRGGDSKGCYICLITKRGPSKTWKYNDMKGAVSFASSIIPTLPPTPPPAPTPPPVSVGGIAFSMWERTFVIKALNKSVAPGKSWDKTNNVSFVPRSKPSPGCHNLGDVTIRVRPHMAQSPAWAIYSSADALPDQQATPVSGHAGTIAAHDITALANSTNVDPKFGNTTNPFFSSIPLRVVRSYERVGGALSEADDADGNSGLVIRINVTNTASILYAKIETK